jgi:hypothetical protein
MAFDPDKFIAEPAPTSTGFDPDAFLKENEEPSSFSATPGAQALSTAGGALLGSKVGSAMDQAKLNRLSTPIPPVELPMKPEGISPLLPKRTINAPVLPTPPSKPTLQTVPESTRVQNPFNKGPSDVINWSAGQYDRPYTGAGSQRVEALQQDLADMLEKQHPGFKTVPGAGNLLAPTGVVSQKIGTMDELTQLLINEQAKKRAAIIAQNEAATAAHQNQLKSHAAEVERLKAQHKAQQDLENSEFQRRREAHNVAQANRVGELADYERERAAIEGEHANKKFAQKQAIHEHQTRPFYKKGNIKGGLLGGVLGLATSPLAEKGYNYLFGRDEEGHAAGGAIQGYAGGKKVLLQKAAHELGDAPGRVTDWLQHHIDKFIVPTQSDRMGGVGGPSFSANSLVLPQYKGLPWGSGNEGTTTAITNLAKDQRFGGPENQIFMPLLGSLNQHQSNQIVYDRMLDEFSKNYKNLSPEAKAQINNYMQIGGGINPKTGATKFDKFADFDITDPEMLKYLGQSFENRGLIAKHGFGGVNTGGKKSQVIPYQKILNSMADPLVDGAPTFAMGPRAFSLSGGVHPVPRPDLNKAFPYLLEGQDIGHTFTPVPNKLIMPDFQNQWRINKGKTEPLKSGELPQPGYYENTLGYKVNKGDTERLYPRQQVTEQLLDTLYKEGHAEGGSIEGYAGGGKLLNQIPKVAQALEEYLKGNISNAERIGIMRAHLPIRKWDELPPNYTDEQIRNALMANKQPKALADVPVGAQVGNRLDIPAYTQNGVYVDTVHDASGKPISYNRTGHLTGVDFSSKPNQAVRVGLGTKEQALTPLGAEIGSGKSPFALMKGTNVGTHDEEVRRMMQEYLNDPKWTQVGMDPRAHSQFFDKSTGLPIFSAEQKLQSGPLVMVPKRGLETTHWDDPRLSLTDFPGKKYAGGGIIELGKKILPLVEREANKAKFLEGNHPDVSQVLYHGTKNDITEFNPKAKAATQGGQKVKRTGAMFFTDNPELASQYTGTAKSPMTGQYYDYPMGSNTGGNMMPVHLGMKNPLVYDAEGKMYHQVEDVIKQARKLGHDSVLMKNVVDASGAGGSLQTTLHNAHIVFDPTQIKSAIGNQGTFDTTMKDITKAEGGLIHLAGGGEAWQRSEGKNPEGGLNAKGRASYNKKHGAHLKAPQPEGGSRKDSFCSRMSGMKKKLTSAETANDPDSRINKALRKWKC